MPKFGAAGEVYVNTTLGGWREFVAASQAERDALLKLQAAADEAGASGVLMGKRFNLANQAQFTMRRLAYGTTLAVIGAGVAALHMGWSYRSAMQTASVALAPVFHGTQALNAELSHLFRLSAFTPFQFKDITIAFRQMYGAFHPLGISMATTNQTILSMVNALAFVGRTSPGALNRVAVALQHMAFQGRLTGQTVLQLARDGLPIYAALTTELGLTAAQMHSVGALGIPAMTALQALNRYIANTPGYANAAMRQATKTLQGAFTTFKDLLSQAVGEGEGGFFGGLQHMFQRIDLALAPFYKTNKPITLTAFVQAVNSVVSPRTGIVINTFKLLNGVLQGLSKTMHGFATAVGFVTGNLARLTGTGKHSGEIFFWFGRILGVVLALWILWRGYLIANRIALVAMTAAQAIYNIVQLATAVLTSRENAQLAWQIFLTQRGLIPALVRLTIATYGFITALILGGRTSRMWINMSAAEKLAVSLRFKLIQLAQAIRFVGYTLVTAFIEGGPIVWLIGAVVALTVGLVILYFKWKWFHDFVNSIFRWFINQSPVVKMAIISAFGPIGLSVAMIYGMVKAIQLLIHWISKIHWPHAPSWLKWGAAAAGGPVTLGLYAAHQAKLFATGGHMTQAGMAIVGERGPELLSLPGGSTVTPIYGKHEDWLHRSLGPQYIQVQTDIYLNRDQIAKAITKHRLDAQARE